MFPRNETRFVLFPGCQYMLIGFNNNKDKTPILLLYTGSNNTDLKKSTNIH